ncbi:hypothetical protein MTO96_012421 [Rhipicephalus appendiculatus]
MFFHNKIAGKEHERGLYQDSDKLASLLIKPQAEGEFHIVSLRLQQLSPPGFISIALIQGSFIKNEPYVTTLNDTVLLGTETLRTLSKYASKNTKMRRADVVFLATGRTVAQKEGHTVRFGTAGLAYLGSACTNNKVGLATDTPKSFSAVQSMTHEIAHLLACSTPHIKFTLSKSWQRSYQGLTAHRISPIKANTGINAAIKAAHHSYQEQVASAKAAALPMSLPENFTIELAFCSDYYHTIAFGNDTKARVQYVLTLVLAVSLRLQQLSPPGFISIVFIQGSSTKKERYVAKLNETVLLGTETLRSLSNYANKHTIMRRADVVFLATGRSVAQKYDKTIRFGTEGLAFMGSACTINKVGLTVDTPKSFSAVQSMTHEIAHLLNSSHDGEGSSRKCDLGDGYLMHMHLGGKWQYLFSNCSILAVKHFLT